VTALGASFSPRRARSAGLDWQRAFDRLLDLELSPIRLSAYWDGVDENGYGELDWQVERAEAAEWRVVVTVGMKAQGWPEYAIPARLDPAARRGAEVGLAETELRAEVLRFVEATIERYRDRRCIAAWQIENESVNRSGPKGWWIGPDLVREEIAIARRLDPARPIVLNAFAAFNPWVDVASCRHGVRRLLPIEALRPEAEVAGLLAAGDVLGLDVYRCIGRDVRSRTLFTRSRRWLANATRWHQRAAARGKNAWIIEAQAEPWEPEPPRGVPSRSCTPADMVETVRALRGAGYDTILLWGAEHWLARDAAGDGSWLEAVTRLRDGAED
jgi:hypothetical protein